MSPHNRILAVLVVVCLLSIIGGILGSGKALGLAALSLIAIGKFGLEEVS